MKTKIQEFDEITQKCEEAYAKLEAKRGTLESSDKVTKIKKAINSLKVQLFKIDQRIGVIRSVIKYKAEEVEVVQHHLYDDINDFEL
jgi:DNA repair ATPase RecN